MANDQATHEQSTRYLTFSLGAEDFAVPLLKVREVIALPEFTPVPHTPPYFLGIMNLRGQVISVMDLRKKLSIKPKEGSETSVIICDLNPLSIGVVVDSVNSVVMPNADEISGKPEIQSSVPSDYITGIYRREGHLVLMLDIAKSLNVAEQNFVTSAGKTKAA